MARGNLQEALNNTNTAYQQLVDIANDIVSKCVKDINPIIVAINNNIQDISS